MDPVHGEVQTTDNLTNKVMYDCKYLHDTDHVLKDYYCFYEIVVPAEFERRYTDENGIRINLPYNPVYKKIYVCFRTYNPVGSTEYVLNKSNHSIWFEVKQIKADGTVQEMYASRLRELNQSGNYNLLLREDHVLIFSGDETDFQIKASMKQNEVFLLKSFAGNLYQHPTTGVGLIEFLHGNFENTGLAAKLQKEFENDKMVIKNAYMNSATGELLLEVEERNG